ncbi:hypothetical protein ACP4OV_008944 [Aristida adscensionis]
MRHTPEDLNIVEWHYLNMYFGSKKFKNISSQNSTNRQQKKTNHSMGSKPFSQCSWEKRNRDTGAEPGVLELWRTTHTKQGKWTTEMAESIYNNTSRKLSMTQTNELGEVEPTNVTSVAAEEDHAFQETYRETIGAKSTKSRVHGYLSDQTTSKQLQERLLRERLERLEQREREFEQRQKEELAKKEAEKEVDRELRAEFQIVFALNHQQPLLHEQHH